MDALVAGLDGAAAYFNDIIITGGTISEHNRRPEAVLQRIHNYGFRVRMEKCAFLKTEINCLGFVVNAEGGCLDPAKIEAIHKMPPPKNVSQLRAFLGLVNFYGTFVKDLHKLRAPLDALTKKDAKYKWTSQCQSSSDRIKATLASDLLLTHFNPNMPIVVAADASNYGIGAVLSHRFPNGSERVVYHASLTLTPAQKNYSQIEKEALALIFAVQKFP
uniref:RNA-directed DNA polymerase n=1 Tax=Ascaris suum TaxID=6253 RepID=F1KWN3_ASCSU